MQDRFDDSIFDRIKDIEVEELLSTLGVDYTAVRGSDIIKLSECPHCGRSDKANFSRSKKVGHCWRASCGERWNMWSFTLKTLNDDKRETINFFRDMTDGRVYTPPTIVIEDEPQEAMEWELPKNTPLPTPEGYTHPYLLERGITIDTQRHFDLRWCEKGWFNYYEDEERRGMFFGDRILIPTYDLDGQIKTFQGRDVTGTAEKRYLFPKKLPGTGRFIYGAHLVVGKRRLIANEGAFDVFATHQAIKGLSAYADTGVIGTYGLDIGNNDQDGDHQIARIRKLIENGLEEVILMWDGEIGAFHAAVKAGRKLKAEKIKVKIATLPEGKDPAEITTAEVRKTIESARTLTELSAMQWDMQKTYKVFA